MCILYESILSLCKERGIKGGKMCVDLGLSKSLMTDLKSGRKKGITAETAQKIADYFSVSVDRVLNGQDAKKESVPGTEREISDNDLKAAFFNGADPSLTQEEMDAMWEDAQEYFRFKIEQRRSRQNNDK